MQHSGRTKATTAIDDCYDWRNPESNTTMLNNAFCAATGHRVLTQTVQNWLHDAQLRSRRPWRGPHLTPRYHAVWYRWAQKHAEWTRQNWNQFLFTDECLICFQPDNCRRRVWRQSGQAECLRHTVQQVQQGGGNLCHWWSWKVLKRLYNTGMTSSDLYCNHIGRISRGISLNGRQFSPSPCTSLD